MIYLVSNGHDKVKIGWSERAKIDDEYPRLKEYISYIEIYSLSTVGLYKFVMYFGY